MPWTNKPAIDDQFLEVGLEAVKQAEELILRYFHSQLKVKLKTDNSPVTQADKEAENLIKKVISNKFPDHGFLGEEEGKTKITSKYFWVIDPIDGTKNFIRGLPHFATLLALIENQQVTLGISNAPAFKELIYAVAGKGCFFNGQKINVSKVNKLSEAYLSIGGIYRFDTQGLTENIMKLSHIPRQVRAWGDAWHFHLLAQGKIDIVIEPFGNFWDFAPYITIVEEAGGKVTDLTGQTLTPESNSIIATNGLFHDEVVEYFKK